MDIKEFLNRPMKLSVLIESKKKRLKWMRAMVKTSESPSYGLDKVQVGHRGPSLVQTSAIELAAYAEEIEEDERELETAINEVKTLLNALASDEEQLILEMRYLDRLDWKEIASFLGYNDRKLFRVHGDALSHAKAILDAPEVYY